MIDKVELFPHLDPARYGDSRNRHNLFLAKYLREESEDYRLRDERQSKAHEILLKWANLESTGKLRRRKESTIEAEFITEVFGQALGYTLFSKGLNQWNLEPKFSFEGGIADAAIGLFEEGRKTAPRAMMELKGPTINVDRDRSQGRTAVQQCWDYLNAVPECPWGIVCNIVSFRLYHKSQGNRAYQLFTLQDLRKEEVFRQFYWLFEQGGLLPVMPGQLPRADQLLDKTSQRQREVGDELYADYHDNRLGLVRHLAGPPHDKPLEKAIYVTQRLLDRIVFMAFCENRGLLPNQTIHKAYSQLPPFHRVTNPRWQNFLNLFRAIDQGDTSHGIPPFDGGLFHSDPEVDDLQLDDEWTGMFDNIGAYDFRDEVNVDVLGHLFERSINDLERLRLGGLFEAGVEGTAPKMGRSAERKKMGIYYTPPDFTKFIVYNTVGRLVQERFDAIAQENGLDAKSLVFAKPDAVHAKCWRACLDALRQVKIVDPACGSGAFLIQAYDLLEDLYHDVLDHLEFHGDPQAERTREQVPDIILRDNLFGVDLSHEAVEITQLALWIRSARTGRTLSNLSRNVVCGNSLVSDPQVDPRAMDWRTTFGEVFSRSEGGFDCVIGNPPWERMKLQEREFFDRVAPEIAAAVDAATRRSIISKLEKNSPELYQRYLAAKAAAEQTLDHVRTCGRYPLTGKGDINTYATFAELARNIVAPRGAVGLLVPSGIATDHTTQEFFSGLVDSGSLFGVYDFENKAPVFPDVHRSLKFCVLLFGGAERRAKSADFVFFAHKVDDLKNKGRHIALTGADMGLLNPNTRTCPIFRTRRDAQITKAIYQRVPVLVDRNRGEAGNPWGAKFLRMFDQTNDAELFLTDKQLRAMKAVRKGPCWRKDKTRYLPLYEAKMIQAYDHRAAGVVVKAENWMRQGQTDETSLVEHQNAEFSVEPRWWVSEAEVDRVLPVKRRAAYVSFKDVTSPTNQRTMIAAFIPYVGAVNSAPLLLTSESVSECLVACLLGNLNSLALDFVARQKVGGLHLNFFIVEQLPIFPPEFYGTACPWEGRQKLVDWISDRVLKLTCTSNDMVPLAEATGFKPPVHKWKSEERTDLQSQLDAAYFLLYGIERNDAKYILSTFAGIAEESENLLAPGSASARILEHYDRFRKACH